VWSMLMPKGMMNTKVGIQSQMIHVLSAVKPDIGLEIVLGK